MAITPGWITNKEGEEEYAIIKLIVNGDKFSTEFTLSHQPDPTKGPEGITFVQAAAYTEIGRAHV